MHTRITLRSLLARCLAVGALGACAAQPPPSAVEPEAEPAASPSSDAEPTASEPAPAAPAPTESSTNAAAASAPTASSDSRTLESIRDVVAANRQKVRDCYDTALKTNPGIVGDLVVSFVIDPQGKVKTAEVNWNESDIHVPELDTCAVAAIRSLSFPPSSKGLESTVNYPFNLNPKQMPPKASKN